MRFTSFKLNWKRPYRSNEWHGRAILKRFRFEYCCCCWWWCCCCCRDWMRFQFKFIAANQSTLASRCRRRNPKKEMIIVIDYGFIGISIQLYASENGRPSEWARKWKRCFDVLSSIRRVLRYKWRTLRAQFQSEFFRNSNSNNNEIKKKTLNNSALLRDSVTWADECAATIQFTRVSANDDQ